MSKAEIMLTGGPWHEEFVTLYADGEFPLEIRVGSADEASSVVPSDFHAGVYRQEGEIDKVTRLISFGHYKFLDMRPTALSLVDVWVT